MDDPEADEDYYLAPQDQRVFGAGIKRRRIEFVPASARASSPPPTPHLPHPTDAGSRYLSIVLPQAHKTGEGVITTEVVKPAQPPSTENQAETCAVCRQPISATDQKAGLKSHESSIAHQFCLEHSHPPSHLDREHVGVRYLSSYGWDPDSRQGLGTRREGIRIPIKAKEKKDTAGLRETVDEDERPVRKKTTTTAAKPEDKIVRLNAKEIRVREKHAQKRAEKLRQVLYGPDLEKYLGPNS